MLPQEFIRKKRDGQKLSPDEIADFIAGLASGAVSEAPGRRLRHGGLLQRHERRRDGRADACHARSSGTVLDWSDLPGPVTDKHSTGGVGDNVSLMLAPIVAACGAYVPMISGRGLGHTGGTLDKMDAIPGYVSQPDIALFRKTVLEAGCAIIGQTADLAPADRRLYAIRDVTATVESVPLITASILSKKLAAGLGSLVLDVKLGNGAFMEKSRDATALADQPCRGCQRRGPEDLGPDHRHERAAGVRRRQCGRGAQRRRFPHRAFSRPAAGDGDAGARRRDAAVGRPRAVQPGRPAHGDARRWTAAGLPPCSAAWWRRWAVRRIFVEKPAKYLAEGARGIRRQGAIATALSPASPPATSASPSLRSAAGAGGPATASIRLSGLPGCCRSAPRCMTGEALALVHARTQADAENAAAAVLAAYAIGPSKPQARKPVLRRILPQAQV